MLRNLLAHPLTRGLGVDDPRTTRRRREIIRGKAFLRRLYEEWYGEILRALPAGEGPILELGSGGGFLNRFIPELITSEVRFTSGIDAALDATRLPFAPASLRAIVMTNVLHHISEPRCFFAEAARCTRPGGGVVLIEPWVSSWSTLIYRRLHEEPYLPQAESWEISGGGPLSGANGALPWILFQRDRRRFERELPEWEITRIRLRASACGGVESDGAAHQERTGGA